MQLTRTYWHVVLCVHWIHTNISFQKNWYLFWVWNTGSLMERDIVIFKQTPNKCNQPNRFKDTSFKNKICNLLAFCLAPLIIDNINGIDSKVSFDRIPFHLYILSSIMFSCIAVSLLSCLKQILTKVYLRSKINIPWTLIFKIHPCYVMTLAHQKLEKNYFKGQVRTWSLSFFSNYCCCFCPFSFFEEGFLTFLTHTPTNHLTHYKQPNF